MILYGSSLSPYVRKTMVIAAEKGIALEEKPGGFGTPDADFDAASPFRKIPALKDGDFSLCDSSAIIAYFEALKPDPQMIPTEAKARAKTIWYEEFADTILIATMGKMFFNRFVIPRLMGREGNLAEADKAEAEELPPILSYLEGVVPDAGGYLVGDRFTLADAAVASPFVNFEHIGVNVDKAKFPRTAAYVAQIHARPSYAPIIAQEKTFVGR